MGYVQCRICGYWVQDTDLNCSNCGHKYPYKKKPTYWSLISLGLSLGIHGLFYLLVITSHLFILILSVFLTSLAGMSLLFFLIGSFVDLKIKKGEIICKKYLINDENNINDRTINIDKRIDKIQEVRKRILSGEKSKKMDSMSKLLDNAENLLINYKNRYKIELWKIALIRWKNTLEPIEFEWQQSNYLECNNRLESLNKATAAGKTLLNEYSKNELSKISEAKNTISDFKDAIAICNKFYEGLTARQAKLAINDVSPLEDKSQDLKITSNKEDYAELFNARSDVTSFVNAFEELESEFDRLEAEDNLALDV